MYFSCYALSVLLEHCSTIGGAWYLTFHCQQLSCRYCGYDSKTFESVFYFLTEAVLCSVVHFKYKISLSHKNVNQIQPLPDSGLLIVDCPHQGFQQQPHTLPQWAAAPGQQVFPQLHHLQPDPPVLVSRGAGDDLLQERRESPRGALHPVLRAMDHQLRDSPQVWWGSPAGLTGLELGVLHHQPHSPVPNLNENHSRRRSKKELHV